MTAPTATCPLVHCEPCESCGAPGKPMHVTDRAGGLDVHSWMELVDHDHGPIGCRIETWRTHSPERCRERRASRTLH